MSLHVFAIVRRSLRRVSLGRVNGVSLRAVNAGAIAAIVADVDGAPVLSLRALRSHDQVVRRIARLAPAVLPVRFGTVVDSERAVVLLLTTWSADLRKALALVDRHQQMTLRLFAPDGGAARPLPPAAPDESGPRPGTRYLKRRQEAARAAQSAPELDPLREALAPIAAAERVVRHDRGPLILTAYHLIPRGAETAYRRALRRHTTALPHRTVWSGPWPPYAFAPELKAR